MARTDIEFIQIEAKEDPTSIRDRLSFYRGKRVLLIWPEEGTALPRKLDLVLIQREAMRRAIRLAIVTHDDEVIKNAKELNISTFETIGASERGRWKRGRSKVFTNRNQRPKDEPDAQELMPLASRIRFRRPKLSGLQAVLFRIFVLAAVIGIIGAVAYVLIPGATVRLVPAQETITAEVVIRVNPNSTAIDIDSGIIPGIPIQIEVQNTATVNATGTQDFGNERAVGTVIFSNDTSQAIDIPSGTTISTSSSDPILFRTTEDVSLPAQNGAQVEASIEAMPAFSGEIGNVESNLINTVIGPLENSVSVLNLSPTSGGASRLETTVTQEDHNLALAYVRQQLQDSAYTAMLEEITPSQDILLETLEISEERDDWTAFDAAIGDSSETVTVRMRAIVSAVAVDMQLAQQIVFARLSDQTLRGREILPETIAYTRGPVQHNESGISFTVFGEGLVRGRINEAQIAQQLSGRSLDNAITYLTNRVDLQEGTQPVVEIAPNWFNQMPILPMRIDVVVVYG